MIEYKTFTNIETVEQLQEQLNQHFHTGYAKVLYNAQTKEAKCAVSTESLCKEIETNSVLIWEVKTLNNQLNHSFQTIKGDFLERTTEVISGTIIEDNKLGI